MTLVHHLSEAWRHADEAEIELRDVVAVRVSRLARNSLEGYFESSLCFQRFLTLVTDELVRPLSVNAVVAQPDNTGSADDAFVEVLYQPVEAAKGVKQRRGSPMLLKLEEISGHEAEYVSNWFKMAERLKPVADLYFGTLYNPSAYLDFNFLCLAHAAEAYHRHVIGGEDVPAEDHEKRMGEVVGAVPEQYQKWLREKLRWSNELSLRRRLKELFSKWAHILTPDKVGDHGDVVRSIVEARNSLTHHEPGGQGDVPSGARLLRLVETLRVLLQLSMLGELGLRAEQIETAITRSRSVRLLAHLGR